MSDSMSAQTRMPASMYLQTIGFFAVMVLALFASAGTLSFISFWVYIALMAAVFIASFLWVDPDLARERMRPGGQKPPVGLQLFMIVMIAHWIIAGLDRGRYHWSDSVPDWLQAFGLAAVAAGYALALWAMVVNRFFSSVVRIQTDRGQHVVDTGPYAVIRHPGYLAGIVIIVASGIALGSWLAALMIIVWSLPFLMYRAITEDRVLQAELPGYCDYAARVRWRVLPGVW
jgi:protein-S-isoprenylcysteine O-methyltransferase Ste14